MLLTTDQAYDLAVKKTLLMDLNGEDVNPDETPIPKWHQDLLEKRELLIAQGKAHFVDWSIAKQQILKL